MTEEWHWLEAHGSVVESIVFDSWWKIALQGAGYRVAIRIAGPMTVVQATGEIASATESDALHALRGATVDAVVSSAGSLQIVTRSGTIRVDADPAFEAWELDGSSRDGDFFVVSGFAGGSPQVFETPPPDARYGVRMTHDFLLTGGCNCGAIRFEVTAPLVDAGYCHCTRCRRRTGTGASLNGGTAPHAFRLLSGEDALARFQPPGGADKVFCARCGSAVFSQNQQKPEVVGIRFGVLDQDPGIRPQYHQFVAYAAAWEPIPEDGLPRYDESRPR